MDNEACCTSKDVGHKWSLDAKKRLYDMKWVESKKCKGLRSRRYHCKEWREARHKMPDAVRSCAMKARSSKDDWKWPRGLMSRPKSGENVGGQQTLEAAVDIGHVAVILFYSIRFCSILFYFISFYSILFCSIWSISF